MEIKKFTFNPFQENTYVLYDETASAAIVDPGCYDANERQALVDFIENKGLKPQLLLNTHAHIDHILGNQFVANKYGLELALHKDDFTTLDAGERTATVYGLVYDESPKATQVLEEGVDVVFGNTKLKVLHVPGHAPGHVVFYNEKEKVIIGGDVLFRGSIGRTDLPGGNHQQLLDQIREKLFVLDEDIKVYTGHGPETTIGEEKRSNPFF
ncbi:MAG TPA: MBL fold metallo-hydrolase [Marinilabiliaceae bacterium]|nr:MBL fold metallo-hydrolase [Marinilabiliaceae bacterium]